LLFSNQDLAMADRNNPYARALRAATRRDGRTIWNDPGRLRSRLHYEFGDVTAEQGAVLDAVVIAAVQGIPRALLDHEDLQPWTLSLGDAVGPVLAAEAIATWGGLLAAELSMPSLLTKLRPPPPVSASV
jgi:hypothetical protein